MKTKSKFRIALVNHANPQIPSHWFSPVSVRKSRAIRLARKLRLEGNPFIVLLEDRQTETEDGRLVNTPFRVSLEPKVKINSYGKAHNAHKGLSILPKRKTAADSAMQLIAREG